MKVTIEKEVCNAPVGKLDEFREPQFGRCDREPHTLTRGGFNGHSSPELRKWHREQTAKSRAKHRKVKETPAPVDDSILDDDIDDLCACGHSIDSCPNPKYCGLSRTQIEERQQREAEEAAYQAQQEAARVRKTGEEQFLVEVLNRYDAGEAIDHQTQASFLATCISYLGVDAKKFKLSRDERIARGFNSPDGMAERWLSEALYGPAYTMLNEPPSRLDEKSFKVRLGRFLGVNDFHGTRNVAHRHHPAHKVAQPLSGVLT